MRDQTAFAGIWVCSLDISILGILLISNLRDRLHPVSNWWGQFALSISCTSKYCLVSLTTFELPLIITNIIPTNFNGSTLTNFINHQCCLANKNSCCLCLASWLVGEREIHALSHYHSLTTLAFNHNQRKTLFSCNFVQNLTARHMLKTIYLYVPSLFALSKRCLLLWWILLCPQTINITPWSVPELPTSRHTSGHTMQYDMINIYVYV